MEQVGLQCSGEEVRVLPSSPPRGSQLPPARLSHALYEGEGGTGQKKRSVVGWVQLGWLPDTALRCFHNSSLLGPHPSLLIGAVTWCSLSP